MERVYVEIERSRQDDFAKRMQTYAGLVQKMKKENSEKQDKKEGQHYDEL